MINMDRELMHHGIQGMKWGQRRWQNEDGSWTPAGRLRYGKGDGREMSENIKSAAESGMGKHKIIKNLSRNSQVNAEARTSRDTRLRPGRRRDLRRRAKSLLGEHASDTIQVGKHSRRAEDLVYKALKKSYRGMAGRSYYRHGYSGIWSVK